MGYGVNASNRVLSAIPRARNALTFARRFKVNLPPGALFYPQCGNDSGEVLLQFMDSISEFHFVNRDRVPVLPALGCRGDQDILRLGSNRYIFPTEIVTAARALPRSHPSFLRQAAIYEGRSQYEKDRVNYTSDNEIWTVASNTQNRVRIYSHRFDEIESMKALSNISVFYCPGPNNDKADRYNHAATGETEQAGAVHGLKLVVRPEKEYLAPAACLSNSGEQADKRENRRSLWFTPPISAEILQKLNNGGIIIVGACLESRCDLLWRRLRRKNSYLRDGSDRNRRPENFTYANRRFRCLGECGYRSGPLFAWQVFHM